MPSIDLEPYIKATTAVFDSMAHIGLRVGEAYVKNDINPYDISGNIGITGTRSGSLTLCLNTPLACEVASRILGEKMDALSEIVIDSVGELANVIAGQVKIIMNDQGIPSKITLPTVLVGPGHDMRYPSGTTCYIIPFTASHEEQTFCLEVGML